MLFWTELRLKFGGKGIIQLNTPNYEVTNPHVGIVGILKCMLSMDDLHLKVSLLK